MAQNLPTELLQDVFMLLSPCVDFPALLDVCTHWRDVCKDTIKFRNFAVSSAFRLQAPLHWSTPRRSTSLNPLQMGPSKRFGSSVTVYGNRIYVFGGATKMFTSFNDLWAFDLQTSKWNRILCEGEPLAPRAYAKGDFINGFLYLFGGSRGYYGSGMHLVRHLDWLTDLNRFDPITSRWSRLPLKHVTGCGPEKPPVCAGQSGCFLPAGGNQEPSVLVLFGGIYEVTNLCVNDLCVIAPEQGQWTSIVQPNGDNMEYHDIPSGRCGHSVCALDSNRMLVVYGNRKSPIVDDNDDLSDDDQSSMHSAASGHSATRQRPFRGKPTGDIWILTRCKPEVSQDWSTVTWFWTKIVCPSQVPSSPPLDFYYMGCAVLPSQEEYCVSLPSHPTTGSFINHTSETRPSSVNRYTVVCVSQPTAHLLEEASRQRRRYLQRIRTKSEVLPTPPVPNATSALLPPCSSSSTSTPLQSACCQHEADGDIQAPNELTESSPDESSSSHHSVQISPPDNMPPTSRRDADRRTRRLEALAVHERRLFGLSEWDTESSSYEQPAAEQPPLHPMAVYTLDVQLVGEAGTEGGHATWLAPRKLHYMDFVGGPQECLGYSITYGYGCVFLFGGLFEPDDAEQPATNQLQLETQPKSGRLGSRPLVTSQLFILQAKALAGTVI